jgi:hypothetical protein
VNNSRPLTNPEFGPSAVHRRLGPSWAALLVGVMVAWAATASSPAHADDEDLGKWNGTTDKDGTHKKPQGNVQGEVYKTKDGKIYIRATDPKTGSHVDVYAKSGSTTNYTKGGVGRSSIQPDAPPGSPLDQFDTGIKPFIIHEIAGLTPQTPGVGTSFFPLELTAVLKSQGDSANLFGVDTTSTRGVIGFDQESNLLSVLGSTTADGLTPVLYQYDPNTTGLSYDFSLTDSGAVTFDSGTTYVPPFQGPDYVIASNSVPEPGSWIMLLGVAGTGACLRWGSRGKAVVARE